jgi:oligoendopeptidase F
MELSSEPVPGGASGEAIPARDRIDRAHTWNLEALYDDVAAWEADFARIEELTRPVEELRGRLERAEDVARLFAAQTELERLLNKLQSYAQLREDEDTGNSENQARTARIRARVTEVSGRLAWITPELLAHPEEELRRWSESEVLRADRYEVVKLLRRKPHVLSEREETLLSRARDVFAAPHKAFSYLTDADLRFPHIRDAQGHERELSQGRYLSFLMDGDRRVRRDAFSAMYETYSSFKNTLAATLSHQVKLQNYIAETRNFPSALAASLHEDNVPVELYEALIAATHEALPHFYRYVDLRRRQLGVDDLDMFDVYVPIVPDYEMKVPFEQARDWVIEACAPLGEEYVRVLRSAFADRWIDIYENRGKRSGAYSAGCYDSLPYILLNYEGTLDHAFTLAHELGHSMHTWLANQSQPPRYASYPIFIAEIPSTLNEVLLLKHLLRTSDDPRFRAYLLNHFCDTFKGTVYRQTMFAEFEKLVHERDASGQPLTAEALSEAYYALNARYFGPGLRADERIRWEWSRIPHFYYNFYVYKYATSFCASQIFIQRVLAGQAQVTQYLDLLRGGGSDDPLALIGRAGVDLTNRATLVGAFRTFGETVEQLDAALRELA